MCKNPCVGLHSTIYIMGVWNTIVFFQATRGKTEPLCQKNRKPLLGAVGVQFVFHYFYEEE